MWGLWPGDRKQKGLSPAQRRRVEKGAGSQQPGKRMRREAEDPVT